MGNLMSNFGKLSLLRTGEVSMAVVIINGEKHVLINDETTEIIKKVNRLLGLTHCTTCGRLVRAEELGYVEIIGNKVVKAVCMDCLKQLHSQIMDEFNECVRSNKH
jgi:hypothetical protein